jgi:hypothetical protein
MVDLGCRGVGRDNPDLIIIHRFTVKSLGEHELKFIKRRKSVEPLIGHLKAEHHGLLSPQGLD